MSEQTCAWCGSAFQARKDSDLVCSKDCGNQSLLMAQQEFERLLAHYEKLENTLRLTRLDLADLRRASSDRFTTAKHAAAIGDFAATLFPQHQKFQDIAYKKKE